MTLAFAGLRDAVRNRDIWLLAATYFVCGASTNGLIGTHLIPACMDHGYSEVSGATLLATIGIFNFFGTLASGWLTDRFDNRLLLFIYFGLRGVSCTYMQAFMLSGLMCLFAAITVLFIGRGPNLRGRELAAAV